MSTADRALAALVAVFAPSRAAALLSGFAGPGSADALAEAVALSTRDRSARLHALRALLAAGAGTRDGRPVTRRPVGSVPNRAIAPTCRRHEP